MDWLGSAGSGRCALFEPRNRSGSASPLITSIQAGSACPRRSERRRRRACARFAALYLAAFTAATGEESATFRFAARRVAMALRARRLFCDARSCPRRVFAERFGGAVGPHVRRAARLDDDIHCRAVPLGGLPRDDIVDAFLRMARRRGPLGLRRGRWSALTIESRNETVATERSAATSNVARQLHSRPEAGFAPQHGALSLRSCPCSKTTP